jgi:EAL domain-containing protein (putative c-di-GMP-specific phosphodiesterase class I)
MGFWEKDMKKEYSDIITQVQMANQLQKGLDRKEFTLYYQPEFDLKTLEIVGVEALVRWYQPEIGFISPEDFIPVAEKSKLIYKLEQWIIKKALSQKLQWEKDGFSQLELSINLSSKTLESECYFNKIEKIISSYKVDYSRITIELTETMNLTNLNYVADRLKRLKKLGIKIALDDFGTGFSSLNHLRTLPVDIIKIDKSFIQPLSQNNREAIITKNMITMAHELDYRVVAEGIEMQEQYDFLIQNCCERGQGFLLCIPIPEDKLGRLIKGCKYKKEIAV